MAELNVAGHPALQELWALENPARPRRVLCCGARGSGRSYWLDTAGEQAAAQGFAVVRVQGSAAQQELAFGGLAAVLAPLSADVTALGDDGAALQQALAGRGTADGAAVKLAALRAITAAADRQPLCLTVDDIDLLDSSSRDVLEAVLASCVADPIVLVAAAVAADVTAADLVVRLEPLADREVAAILALRGVAPAAAARCAAAAGGNPGVAVAMADALSDAQRRDEAPVADLPRLGGHLAAELQARMRGLGEACCRALVVAAATDGGDLGAVDSALRQLGEPGTEALEPAEEAGVVELIGPRVVFPDPFTRHAAYHLLAPASRRAAHRALAAAFTEPHQAAARVWHLVGAASGPSDALADALSLVAADAVRRGAPASAARTYERAVEFAATGPVREEAMAAAAAAAVEAGDLDHAVRLLEGQVPFTDELRAAIAVVHELRTGRLSAAVEAGDTTDPADLPTDDSVASRLARRRAAWAAAAEGDHRAVLRLLGERPRVPFDAVPVAVALRHAGRTRDARDLLAGDDALEHALGTYAASWWAVVRADLDVLAGRPPEATDLALPAGAPEPLRALAAAVAARARLAAEPELPPADVPAAWGDEVAGPLADVRGIVRAAITAGDAAMLDGAIAAAEEHRLDVEAGEARLWQAVLRRAAGDPAAVDTAKRAQATLQRCGVRCWDGRLAAVAAPGAPAAPRPADPALDALSPAERRVADAVSEGLTNREVASTLFLSVKTVDFHLQQIYRKLGVRSRTELAVRVAGKRA
ncbi:MAG: LuxR C-terminal-related transcriptional regulator [Ilumatobacteraceae bacterium]